jgi:hypothetical protein
VETTACARITTPITLWNMENRQFRFWYQRKCVESIVGNSTRSIHWATLLVSYLLKCFDQSIIAGNEVFSREVVSIVVICRNSPRHKLTEVSHPELTQHASADFLFFVYGGWSTIEATAWLARHMMIVATISHSVLGERKHWKGV